jgi:hypothetical protein
MNKNPCQDEKIIVWFSKAFQDGTERKEESMEKLKPEAIRVNLGMTVRDFANAIGIKQIDTYRSRVLGRTEWKAREAVKMANLAKVTVEQLDLFF